MTFTPTERPVLAVAIDGTLAAIHEPTRISIVELPGIAPFAEIGIDPDSVASDVAWIGMPPRLVVLSRYAGHSIAHLVDPNGPRTIAEIRLETAMKLFGTTGNHALVVGPMGAAILTATGTHLTPYQFPARTVPATAGAAGGQFVVGLSSAVEEWDPAARMPKRRLKLPRQSVITAVGGTDRVVWLTTQHDRARIDVIPFVNRGQPKTHDLPEPIEQVSAHPRADLLACVGAQTGRLYVVDLDGRSGMRVIGPPGIVRVEAAALVVGSVVGVLAAQANHPLALVAIDGREQAEGVTVRPAAAQPQAVDSSRAKSTLFDDSPEVQPDEEPRPSLFRSSPAIAVTPAAPAVTPVAAPPPSMSALSTTERLNAWRDRVRDAPASAPQQTSGERRPTWRDRAVSWYRAVAAGSAVREAPVSSAIGTLVARLDLPMELQPAVVLLYGAHLAGSGAAPVDIARVLDHGWAEALGRGQLAARGIAVYDGSRVRLARAIQRALDELPPETGTLVGEPGTVSLLGPCAVVADRQVRLVELAPRFVGAVGSAILVGDGLIDILEAQVRGAVPMMRTDEIADIPMIVVADSEHAADRLGLPRID